MKVPIRLLAVAAIFVGVTPALAVGHPAVQHSRSCARTFSLPQVKRAISATYSGTDLPGKGAYGRLHRYVRCLRNVSQRPAARVAWRAAHDAWAARRHPFHGPVIASWFDDAGGTACGIHATYGFATLLSIPCGATITMRGPNGMEVRATREDSGPYIAGRTFDLNPALKAALGCGDICSVMWR